MSLVYRDKADDAFVFARADREQMSRFLLVVNLDTIAFELLLQTLTHESAGFRPGRRRALERIVIRFVTDEGSHRVRGERDARLDQVIKFSQ